MRELFLLLVALSPKKEKRGATVKERKRFKVHIKTKTFPRMTLWFTTETLSIVMQYCSKFKMLTWFLKI